MKICFILTLEALLYGALLFGAAGTVHWPAGWAYFVLFFAGAIALTVMLARRAPALLAERIRPPLQKNQPLWDKIFLIAFLVAVCGWTALMPLDAVRFHWSHMPAWLPYSGAALMVLSFLMMGRVFLENTFLAGTVKIQEERGHHVISTGPYAVVRHPLYAAALLYLPATAMLLGSWYGLAASSILAGGLVFRTAMEERELRCCLPGYTEYAARVPYRLIPRVW